MSLIDKERQLIEDFSIIEDPVERFSVIVDHGRSAPPLPDDARIDQNLVPGCTSLVWLTGFPETQGDTPSTQRLQFRCEADAPSVHGVAALLCELYSGATPAEVAAFDPEILTALRIDRQLTPTRMRGLGNVIRRIRDIASAFEK